VMTASVCLMDALQILENRQKDGFLVCFVATDVGDQERNAGKFLVMLVIGGKVLRWLHE
jgi:hypothetical protein